MLRLDTINRKLQLILGGAVATSQLPVTVSYSDKTAAAYTGATQLSTSNGATAVDICNAPAAATVRDIDYLSVRNADTAPAAVTLRLNDNGTLHPIVVVTLAVGDHLAYTHGSGWEVRDSVGTVKITLGGVVNITGGTITGITDLAVADGGTGASDAAGARTNLGLGTIATQNANAVAITGGTASGITLTSPVISTPAISGGSLGGTISGDHTLSGQVSFTHATAPIITSKLGPSGTQQHSIPVVASDTFVLRDTAQTLLNKTLTSPAINGASATTASLRLLNTAAGVEGGELTIQPRTGTALGGDVFLDLDAVDQLRIFEGGGAVRGFYFPLTSATAGVGTAVVGHNLTQALTNKTLDLASNTLTGTVAQFNAALSGADFATLAGTETLTNKTLTSPSIGGTVGAVGTAFNGIVFFDSNTQTGYSSAAVQARSTAGDVHIGLHASGATAATIKHTRGQEGISILTGVGASAPLTASTLTATEQLVVGSGGTFQAGSIYSDPNWGLLVRAKQASPVIAEFAFQNAGGTERYRVGTGGNFEIGTQATAGNTLRYLDLQNTDTGAAAGAILRLITSNAAASGVTTFDIVKYKTGASYINNNETDAAAYMGFAVNGERLRIESGGHTRPGADNAYSCGTAANRWSVVYAATGTINTSDAREKTDVVASPLGLDFILALQPKAYRWLNGGNTVTVSATETELVEIEPAGVRPVCISPELRGADGQVIAPAVYLDVEQPARYEERPKHVIASKPGTRTHYGLLAQDVKAAVEALGAGDFAGWVMDDPTDPDSRQGLRYDQFIAPLIKAVQEQQALITRLQERVAALEPAA